MNCQPPGAASVAEAPAWARSTDPGVSAATTPWPAAGPAALPAGDSSSRSRSPPVHGSSARTGEGSNARTMVTSPRPAQRHMSLPESFAWSDRSITLLLALGVTDRSRRCRRHHDDPHAPTCTVWIAWSLCSPLASRPGSGLAHRVAPGGQAGVQRPHVPVLLGTGRALPGQLLPPQVPPLLPPLDPAEYPRRGRRAGSARLGRGANRRVRVESRLLRRPRPTLALVGRGLLRVLPPLGIGIGRLIGWRRERSGRDPRMARSSPLVDNPAPDRRVPGSRRVVGRTPPGAG